MLNTQSCTPVPRTKAQIARENGSKSRGPITAEGKSRSAMNSLKHSLTAKTVVVATEDHERFQLHCDSYLDLWNPVNVVEEDLVEEMAVAKWQEKRCQAIETALLNFEMKRQEAEMDESTRLAAAFMKIADESRVLSLLLRYGAEHNRRYHRAMRQLLALRSKNVFKNDHTQPPQEEKRNEPRIQPKAQRTNKEQTTKNEERAATDHERIEPRRETSFHSGQM